MKPYLLGMAMLLLVTVTVFGQGNELALHVFAIGSLPSGNYGKDIADDTELTRRSGFSIGDKIGLADIGSGAGVELVAPVGFRGLQWIFSGKAIINGSNSESVQREFRSELGDTVDLMLDYGHWLNFPVMTGFRYDHQFTRAHTIYGILQAGVNFSKMASRKAMVGNLTVEEATFEFARDFGFEIGMGVLYDQRFNFGFRYLTLRSPRYEGTKTISEIIFPEIVTRNIVILGEERTISMFIVTLGIQLFK